MLLNALAPKCAVIGIAGKAHDQCDEYIFQISGTTLLLHAITSSTDQTEPRSRGGHVALKDMIKYAALLEEALANGHISLNLHDGEGDSGDGRVLGAMSCLILPRRWALFMKKVCDIFTKVTNTAHLKRSIHFYR